MKRTIALLTALCCLLAAVPAFAASATAEAVTFDTFTFTPWAGAYVVKGDPSTGTLFQCFPYYNEGDYSTNMMGTVLSPVPIDVATMDEANRADFIDGLKNGITSGFAGQGVTLRGTEVTLHDPVTVSGRTGLYFDLRIDMKYMGVDLSVYETGCAFSIGTDCYVFMTGGETQEKANAVMDEFLASLVWIE